MGSYNHGYVEQFTEDEEPLICSSNEQVFTGEGISFFTGTSFFAAKDITERFSYPYEPTKLES